ncbi:MAG TPA: SDR family NAD(P)-dependent oxidoreductase [Terricaulis sp.]|nr:SDR family NAD(P)-dependent oxidoreductase [Terricaulis sp.]
MNDLAGKHAFITGGGTGIGLAAARALAARGAKLTLAARNFARVEAAAAELGANPVGVDVTSEASINAGFEAARNALGPVDILVNNAGLAPSAPFHKTDLALWNQVLTTNLTGAFLCTHAALPDMYAAGWGRIVNVASVCSLKGYAYVSAYCASKHGLLGFTRALAHETAKRGVTVNAVCPGYVATEIVTNAQKNITEKTALNAEDAIASIIRFNPQGRLIEAEEVASAIAWLCGEGAASVNGAALPMTGGEI